MVVVALFVLLTALSGAYFTSIGCRHALARHRRPGWHWALVGTLITTVLTTLAFGQGDLFDPSRWDKGKVPFWQMIGTISSAAAVSAFVASVIVVLACRLKFRNYTVP
jgi:amino acid transporter